MSGFVVADASITVKWLVWEDDTDMALAILESWESEDVALVAPSLMPFEVSNALHRKASRGEIGAEDATALIVSLTSARIELRQPEGLHQRALEIASRLGQSAAYDAHYLALADIMDCDMWTADRRFFRAASAHADNVRWLGEFAAQE